MSRTRSPALRQWSPLDRSTLLFTTPGRSSILLTIGEHSSCKPNNRNPSLPRPRPFHTTCPHSAAHPAPSTRRRIDARLSRAKPAFPGRQLLNDSPKGQPTQNEAVNARLEFLKVRGLSLASEMLHDGVIDKSVTPGKFKRIGTALIMNASSISPSRDAITGIAEGEGVHVDVVYDIGREVLRGDQRMERWLQDSCQLANVRMANFRVAAWQLKMCHGHQSIYDAKFHTEPRLTPSIALVEMLATRPERDEEGRDTRDPRAMVLWAKFQGLRGHYREAIRLVQEVMRLIEPSRTHPRRNENPTINGMVEPPWELYMWLRREEKKAGRGRRANGKGVVDTNTESLDTDEEAAMRLGAIEYQDPSMLMRYAQYCKERHQMDLYEEHMGKAAASGYKDACRKLGNYYYLVATGQYPRRGARPAESADKPGTQELHREVTDREVANDPEGFFAKLFSYFGPRPLSAYRSLAMEWWRVGWAQGCASSGLNLARLLQEEGDKVNAEKIIKEVQDGTAQPKHLPQAAKITLDNFVLEDKASRQPLLDL
ncbi:predicted protein [Aspergillus nidulans FGSC A4]|uniref:Uncharacterized protein n=1 Tax=Emericella nidulans (strain FGSC A4 / ATCC 38163 / CBS 112.46 / NRRL 194 / M139) TaxID=227321 RepID=Q5BBM2_EMENI|nr:hypothetical protein [Aspergillus nidulans FGSC A4]EAA64890.1 predicted protein [Aspergillus nidulans FGSC A4]CBF86095.1 TPA: conserved hypothetical protein [Aspergillus nidulans FGSC A4]|eukprot:XP_659662.1 predicted protein [Aspergillus nidulans FGSC A4]